jgi:hypothetical protein
LANRGHVIIVGVAVLFLTGCSYDNDTDYEYRRGGPAGNGAALVAAKCGKCHNGSTHPLNFDSPEKFKTELVIKRISEGTMPPGGGLDAASKDGLLKYAKEKTP